MKGYSYEKVFRVGATRITYYEFSAASPETAIYDRHNNIMYYAQTDNSSVMFKTAEIYNFIITPHIYPYETFSKQKYILVYIRSFHILQNIMKYCSVFPFKCNDKNKTDKYVRTHI